MSLATVSHGVAHDVQPLLVLGGDDADAGVFADGVAEVALLAVHFDGNGGFREAGADAGGDFRASGGLIKLTDGTVGQGNV